MEKAPAKAVCIGVNQYLRHHDNLCSRGAMCPKCESRRASQRAWSLTKRLEKDVEWAEDWNGQMQLGVLTVTLPGRKSSIRGGSLRQQYNYMTERKTLPYKVGHHSMRGLNSWLADAGVTGGCHNIEFTYNSRAEQWNTHMHSILVGTTIDQEKFPLKSTTEEIEEEGQLLLKKIVGGRFSTKLDKFGFGRRYSLDWAEPHEWESQIRYCAKVAYMTKPIKAPAGKRKELRRFFSGVDGGKSPRLSRPIGDWRKQPV